MMGLPFNSLFDDPSAPQTIDQDGDIVLIENFIPRDRADTFFQSLFYDIDWQEHQVFADGRWRLQPRLIHWFGDREYQHRGLSLTPTAITRVATLSDIARMVEGHCKTTFNTCLANLYRSGEDSIGMHADTEPELGDQPLIASISLGGTRKFRLHERRGPRKIVLPLHTGSLLIMRGNAQRRWLHGINKEPGCNARINFTFRIMHP